MKEEFVRIRSLPHLHDPNHPAGAGIPATANVTLSYNARGQLASVTDGTGTRVYGYNGSDRLETETLTTPGGQTEKFTYSLDTLGRRAETAGTDPLSALTTQNRIVCRVCSEDSHHQDLPNSIGGGAFPGAPNPPPKYPNK